jgi:hypothetical protein
MALEEARDRYGAPPPSVLNLAEYGRIRIMADRLGVESIDREGRLVVLKFRPQARVEPVQLLNVVSGWPGATFVPPVSLKLDLEAAAAGAVASKKDPPTAKQASGQLQGRRVLPPGAKVRAPAPPPSSWWAARATAGEVTSGFTKEEVTRKPEADPRAEGGMFAQLERLLRALGS